MCPSASEASGMPCPSPPRPAKVLRNCGIAAASINLFSLPWLHHSNAKIVVLVYKTESLMGFSFLNLNDEKKSIFSEKKFSDLPDFLHSAVQMNIVSMYILSIKSKAFQFNLIF